MYSLVVTHSLTRSLLAFKCAVVEVVPLSLSTAAAMLRLVFAIRFVIMLSLNVAFRAPFFPSFCLRNGSLAFVVLVTVW